MSTCVPVRNGSRIQLLAFVLAGLFALAWIVSLVADLGLERPAVVLAIATFLCAGILPGRH